MIGVRKIRTSLFFSNDLPTHLKFYLLGSPIHPGPNCHELIIFEMDSSICPPTPTRRALRQPEEDIRYKISSFILDALVVIGVQGRPPIIRHSHISKDRRERKFATRFHSVQKNKLSAKLGINALIMPLSFVNVKGSKLLVALNLVNIYLIFYSL